MGAGTCHASAKFIVDTFNAWTKNVTVFRNFSMPGQRKAAVEWKLVCTVLSSLDGVPVQCLYQTSPPKPPICRCHETYRAPPNAHQL